MDKEECLFQNLSKEIRSFNNLFYPSQEERGRDSVHSTVVMGQTQVGHRPDGQLTFINGGSWPDLPVGQNGALRRIDNGSDNICLHFAPTA